MPTEILRASKARAGKIVRRPQRTRLLNSALAAGLPAMLEEPLRYVITESVPAEHRAVVDRVEGMRAALAARAGETVEILYSPKPGSAGKEASADLRPEHGEVKTFDLGRVANQTSVGKVFGPFLYLCAKNTRAETILELGACAGIASAYLSSAGAHRFVGIEGAQSLAAIADGHAKQANPRAEVINGLFDDVLDELLPTLTDGVDMAWIDGHHEKVATIHYFQRLKPVLNPGAVLLFDDISWSQDMRDGWNEIAATAGFSDTIDLGTIGLAVWRGGDSSPRAWDLSALRGRTGIGRPHGWS